MGKITIKKDGVTRRVREDQVSNWVLRGWKIQNSEEILTLDDMMNRTLLAQPAPTKPTHGELIALYGKTLDRVTGMSEKWEELKSQFAEKDARIAELEKKLAEFETQPAKAKSQQFTDIEVKMSPVEYRELHEAAARQRIAELTAAQPTPEAAPDENAQLKEENSRLRMELEAKKAISAESATAQCNGKGLPLVVCRLRREGKSEREIAKYLSGKDNSGKAKWCSASQIGALLHPGDNQIAAESMRQSANRLLG